MAKDDAGEPKPKRKAKSKPKLTDKERHKRFVDMAHEVGADESQEAFESAFKKVVLREAGEKLGGASPQNGDGRVHHAGSSRFVSRHKPKSPQAGKR